MDPKFEAVSKITVPHILDRKLHTEKITCLTAYDYPTARLVDDLAVGQRVRVPLGRNNRPQHGYVIAIAPSTEYPKVKPILAISDQRILLPPKMLVGA